MQNARLDESQAGFSITGRNKISVLQMMPLETIAENKKELRSLLMRVKEESEKAALKLIIQKTMIMESSPITAWQIKGEKMETLKDFIFLGSKIAVDGDCSHESKRHLLLGGKALINLDSILKIRHYFADKGLSSQSNGFSSSHV